MQAQIQPVARSEAFSPGRNNTVGIIAAIYLAIHAAWLIVPLFVDHDMPAAAWVITSTSLALGVIALGGLWNGQRWAWWMAVILCVLNVFLTGPEAFGLEGLLRVISILALVGFVTMLVLLFRPGVRSPRS